MVQTPNAGVSISKRISCVLIFVEETFMKNVSRHPGLDLAPVIIMEKKCGVCCCPSACCRTVAHALLCIYEHRIIANS